MLQTQETQIRITPPPPYNHQNSQDNQIIANANLMQSSKPNADNSQGQNITNLPNIPNSINSGSSTNSSRRSMNRVGGGSTSLTVKNAVMRYNRRNNPELEKRRIHHCDFLGEHTTFFVCTFKPAVCFTCRKDGTKIFPEKIFESVFFSPFRKSSIQLI